MPTEDDMEMELMKREFEGMSEEDALRFSRDGGARLYDVEEGHGRGYMTEQDGKYVFVYMVCDQYRKPGSFDEKQGAEMPLFGLVVHNSEHARALAKSFELMADYIMAKEGGKR